MVIWQELNLSSPDGLLTGQQLLSLEPLGLAASQSLILV